MTIYDKAPNPQTEKLAFIFIILSISSRETHSYGSSPYCLRDFPSLYAGFLCFYVSRCSFKCHFLFSSFQSYWLSQHPPIPPPPIPLGQLLLQSNFSPGQVYSVLVHFLSTKVAPCDSVHLMSCFSSRMHVKNAFWPAKTAPFPTIYIPLCFQYKTSSKNKNYFQSSDRQNVNSIFRASGKTRKH